ncbi:MAG: MarR family transcriptional regulator [Rhizobiaceae bacterium]|nr:MarR family transcriptional regulator [Rhizobiaceae bacterium]
MENLHTTNALRLLQSADEFKANLSGEFSAIHGISVNEYFLLLHLQKAPRNRLPRVELAKRMHISASTITRMTAPMEKIGLVDREVDDRDARLAFVVLTATGEEKLAEANQTFAKRAGYAFEDRWDDQELKQLSELLHRLIAGSPASLT